MQFQYSFNRHFSFFITDNDGNKIPVIEWGELKDSFLSQLSILFELKDNGNAHFTTDSCNIDIIEVLGLSVTSKQILWLPSDYPYEIYIQSNGQLNQSSFRFTFDFFDFAPNGTRLNAKRNGPIIAIEDSEYLLSENQFRICEALAEFNSLPEEKKTFENNLNWFAEIKRLSKGAELTLDSYLNGQNVFKPERIKIDLQIKDDKLEVLPNVGIQEEHKFIQAFDKLPTTREVYPISDGQGNTTRILLNDKQKEELAKLKKIRKVENKEIIQELVDKPESFFDEEVTDFNIFYSERVKEIGIYKPRFYPFISPYKSEWIPGIIIKDIVSGEKRIYFKTQEEIKRFIEARDEAVKLNQPTIPWKDEQIPLDVADKIIRSATRKDSGKGKLNEDIDSDTAVLIIKENSELTEFSENNSVPSDLPHHRFSEIKNLVPNISLRNHQIEGVSWLQTLNRQGLSGCLLADDMGVGKTVQLLYFIEWHSQFNNKQNKPYLIVAPVSLLENWENEYERFFRPRTLELTKLYGAVNLTKSFDKIKNQKEANALQRKHLILTNYETLRSYQATLCLVEFAVVALDEAQKIKTPGTLVTNSSKALKSDFKVALTGTPVENTLIDIWCIMDFSSPGLLGNAKDFAKEFQNPLKEENVDVKELTEKLRRKIGFFIKRRLKMI